MKRIIKKIANNKIIKTGSLSLIATVFIRAINLISVPIFSRMLSTAEYGQVDVFMTFVNIFFVVLGLDFHSTIAKARLDFSEDADKYICSGLIATTIFATIFVGIVNVGFVYVHRWFGLDRWAVNIMFIYSYSMFVMSTKSSDYNFYYKYDKNMKMTVTVGIVNLVLSIAFISTIFSEARLLGRILGATIPTFLCAIIVYLSYAKQGQWSCKKEYNIYAFKFGIPLIPHNLSHLVLSSSDRLMINSMISASASGIYGLTYTLGMMIQVASEAMNQVYGPWLFRRLQEGHFKMVTYVQKLYLLSYSMVTIAVLVISPEILKFIGPPEYWDGTTIIMWVVYATFVGFAYTLYVNIEFFYKKTALISLGTFLAAIVNVLLNKMFLLDFGYKFAAFSTVISYLLLLIFHMLILNIVMKKKIVDNVFVIGIVLFICLVTVLLNKFNDFLFTRVSIGCVCELILIVSILGTYKKGGKIEI